MNIYTPTWLYIKEHSLTKLKYFGKTTTNPDNYYGSGTYWTRHINKHGKEHVITTWKQLFVDKEQLKEFAIKFSLENKIVESESWANLAIETGESGGPRKNSYFKIYNNLPKTEEWRKQHSNYWNSKRGTTFAKKACFINGISFASRKEAAKHFGVSEQSFYKWIKKGKISIS